MEKTLTDFKKYPEIGYLEENIDILGSDDIKIFEKIDGANAQFRNVLGRLRYGSRGDWLDKKRQKPIWASAFEEWVYKDSNRRNIPEKYIVYGEWYGLNNIFYNSNYLNSFFLIDIYDLEKKKFLDYENSREIILNALIKDIVFLRVLKKGKTTLKELNLLLDKSDYYDGPREGVVIKDYKNQRFVKFLHPIFQEFRKDPNLPIIEKYVTETRIKKIIEKKMDNGETIDKKIVVQELKEEIERNHKIKIRENTIYVKINSVFYKYKSFLEAYLEEISNKSYKYGKEELGSEEKKDLLEKYFPQKIRGKNIRNVEEIEEKFRYLLELAFWINKTD